MSEGFKAGDRVKLTGKGWAAYGLSGAAVTLLDALPVGDEWWGRFEYGDELYLAAPAGSSGWRAFGGVVVGGDE